MEKTTNRTQPMDAEKVLKNLIENERKASFEKNKTESYSAWEMILIFVFGPLKFFHRYDVVFSLRKKIIY